MDPNADRPTEPDEAAPTADRYVLIAGHVLFAVLLMLGTVRSAISATNPIVPILAAAVAAVWYCAGAAWISKRHGRIAQFWLAGLIVIWLGLIVLSGEFVWLAFLLALLVWHLLPATLAVPVEVGLALAAAVGFAAHQGQWVPGAVLGPAIGVACAAVMTEIYQRLRAQSEERRRLLDDLVRTQRALAAREREAGRLAERERLAREIHDTVGQSLASVILLLKAALGPSKSPDPQAERTAQLRTALDTASAALAETRYFVRGLDPVAIETSSLRQALQSLANEGSELGLATTFVEHGEPLPTLVAVEVALLRAAQEALSNARQHSRATHATLTLTYQADEVSIDVVDDGVGFDPAVIEGPRSDGSGYGLTSMRGRIADCGGDLTVESEPCAGTAIRATVPITGAAVTPGVGR